MVVRHRLFDQRDLEVAVGLRAEQVVAHHRLVEVRGDLGQEQAVAAVDEGLVARACRYECIEWPSSCASVLRLNRSSA